MDSKDLKIISLIAVAFVVVVGVTMVMGGVDESPSPVKPDEPTTPVIPVQPEPEPEPIVDAIFLNYKGEKQLIIDDIPSGSRCADEGMIWYVVSYTLENCTSSSIRVYTSDFIMTVGQLTYSPLLRYSDDSYVLAKDDLHKGSLTFLIPEDATGIVMSYKDAQMDDTLELQDIPMRAAGQIYGKITYKASTSYGFTTADGDRETPKSGSKFIIVEYTLKNVSYEDTIDANPYSLEIDVNGVRYVHDWATSDHPDYIHLPKVTAGNSVSTVVVFEVKSTVDLDDITLVWEGYPKRGIEIVRI